MSIFHTISKKFNEDNYVITNGIHAPFKKTVLEDRMNNLIDLKKVFKKFDIKYVISCGTLLGCIRKNRLIPYDTDDDIFIFDEQIDKFNSEFLKEMEKYNFKLLPQI